MVSDRPLTCVHYLASIHLTHGGVDRAVLDVCRLLVEYGQRVVLLTRDPQDVPEPWLEGLELNLKVITLEQTPGPLRKLSVKDRGRVLELFHEADVLHLHTPWERTNLEMAWLARSCHTPYVVSVHGMLDDWCMSHHSWRKRAYLFAVGRRLLNNAAAIHCTAEGERAQAKRWHANPTTPVLPCLFDTGPFMNLTGPSLARDEWSTLQGPESKLLFLSRIHPKKGIEYLIDATAQLGYAKQSRVIVAGPGDPAYVKTLRQRAADRGLAERLQFVGMVDGPLKLSLYQACDLFVLPTHQENFGFVLPEAMLCRTPVITTRNVDIWPELESGGATIIDLSVDALVQAIDGLLCDRLRLNKLGDQGRTYILDWLNPGLVADRYIAMYRHILETDLACSPRT